MRINQLKPAPILAIVAMAITFISCGTNPQNNNSSKQNAKKGGLPADAKPMGQAAPGFFTAGPYGNVSLHITSPKNGQLIEGNSIAPTFTITGFPIYMDTERKKGQHIHVVLDDEDYEACYDADKPFEPESGRFKNLKPGVHTLRAFPGREWHESIKQTDNSAFDMVVFYVKTKPPRSEINEKAPLLTYSRPKGEYRWKDDPRGMLVDFYVSNATISFNDYKIKYTVNGKNPKILTRWEPIWWKWEELAPGTHKLLIELLDKNNKPLPFIAGGVDYNRSEHTFKILADGEKPSPALH